MRYFFIFPVLFLFSCGPLVEKVKDEVAKTLDRNDSIAELDRDNEHEDEVEYLQKDYKVLQRKKEGDDSLFLVRSLYVWNQPYADVWYRNDKPDGIATVYRTDGSVFYKMLYKNGDVYSVLEAYDSKGKKLDYGDLKNGNGLLKLYDPITDLLASETRYKGGVAEGESLSYYHTGELHKKCNYTDGVLNGYYYLYFKNGSLKEKAFLSDGAYAGNHYVYFRSGKVRLFEKRDGDRVLYSTEFDRREHRLRESRLEEDGYYEITYSYDAQGSLLSKGHYRNYRKFGPFEYYYNGRPKALEQWRNDSILSEREWYENGSPKSVAVYRGNERDSIYTEYYSNGKLRLRQEYRNGKKHGFYHSYYETGQKYVIGYYENDKPKGKFDYYARDGKYKGQNEFK